MTTAGTGAVFFLGTRAHYQVLQQPNNHDVDNGNASTESVYQNASVEELWPSGHTNKHNDIDANCNTEKIEWSFIDHKDKGENLSQSCNSGIQNDGNKFNMNNTLLNEKKTPTCVKRRGKRRSSEALLCEDIKPALLNILDDKSDEKLKPPRRVFLLSYLASLARRTNKRRMEPTQVHYLQHLESALTTCTYRESCRCLDCQGRYFECGDDSDDYSSDEDTIPYNKHVDSHCLPKLKIDDDDDDEVFVNPVSDDNKSTDLLLEDSSLPEDRTEMVSEETLEDMETDKQLQMEVAASTSAMFNVLLYHPFSCSIQ